MRSDVIEITDVYNPTGLPSDQLFIFELDKEGGPDFVRQVDLGSVKLVNVKTLSNTVSAGNTCPMTLIGGYGGATPKFKQHAINIDSLYVEEFFSINSLSQIIDGDSDVFRIFTNPTNINIKSVSFINSAKRLLKGQQQVISHFDKMHLKLDNRFTGNNFISAIDFQNAESGLTSSSTIGMLITECQDYDSSGVGKPRVFTASGLNGHSFQCDWCRFKKLGVFFSGVGGSIVLDNSEGYGSNINASLVNVELRNFKDSNFEGILSSKTRITDFELTINPQAPSSFKITNAILNRGSVIIPTTEYRVASVISVSSVTLTYSAITTDRRPFQPASSAVILDDVSVVGGLLGSQLMDAPASPSAGTITVARFRSTTRGIASMGSGAWKFKLDDCDLDNTVAGAGVASSLKVQYV
ncbi:hypothetical protein [Aeromonas sp.]|uniref:hypothetical protein n=1 Tax=Aeromonas sp. TaxID=647 RepID=UPI0025898C4A|nr:hypothetical protein [Aeromonas sp.]MCX7132265.1 hypothetical protein [Aeromonas sp.]